MANESVRDQARKELQREQMQAILRENQKNKMSKLEQQERQKLEDLTL